MRESPRLEVKLELPSQTETLGQAYENQTKDGHNPRLTVDNMTGLSQGREGTDEHACEIRVGNTLLIKCK